MLNSGVLVLNRSWVAVNVATARRALVLVCQGHARVVHPRDFRLYDFDGWVDYSEEQRRGTPNGHRYIHAPNLSVLVPEVILLGVFNGFIRKEARFSRRNLFLRDGHQCQYCGAHPPRRELSIDHVIPRSRGGRDTWENLVIACQRCNVRKGDRTPEEAGMQLLRRPAAPRWLPRFGMVLEPDQLNGWQRFLEQPHTDKVSA